MTVEEKRRLVIDYCGRRIDCGACVLKGSQWQHINTSSFPCLDFENASEEELDEAIRLIKSKASDEGAALVEAQIKELKSAAAVIQLEVGDGSVMSVANAICKHYVQYSDTEKGLIELDELTEHIDAYVRAERKALEYKKLAEED